jgi:hypothetical protein
MGKSEKSHNFLKKSKSEGYDVFLDSGAFSSDTINVEEYADFLKENK